MSIEFPTLAYICPGNHQVPGGTYNSEAAKDQKELDALIDAGYSLTLPEAIEGNKPVKKEVKEDNSAPTRDEAKDKADKLGIEYPKNIPTNKLIKLIEDKLAEQK